MERHQSYRMPASQPKIHTALQARTFPLAHFEIGNDIASHGTLFSALNARSNGRSLWSAACEKMAKPFTSCAEQAVSFIDLIVMCPFEEVHGTTIFQPKLLEVSYMPVLE